MPIIEFGDSDSGTREIRKMLIAFGVTMPQDMDNGSGDLLKLFAVGDPKAFPNAWSTREKGDVNCLPMIRSILKNRHGLDYDAKDLPSGILAPTLRLLKCAASSIAAHVATKSEGTGLWGWKNPRQIVLAPVWAQLFGGPACTLMVQTVRDGRDSAWAHNPVQFNNYAASYFRSGTGRKPADLARYWSSANVEASEWAARMGASGKLATFITIRIEDLVDPSHEVRYTTLRHLLLFVLKPVDGWTPALETLAQEELKKNSNFDVKAHYFGAHWRNKPASELKAVTCAAKRGLLHFKYEKKTKFDQLGC